MVKRTLVLLITASVMMTVADAKVVKGVNVPDTLKAGNESLILNGAGIRTKFFMDIYVGALYLKKKETSWSKIVNADEPMAVRLHIVSGLVTPERMAENTREGFKKSTGGNIGPIKEQMEKFIGTFKDGIKVNDYYDIIYIPSQGVKVYKKGALRSSASGLNFKKALFGIWVGANPIQEGLKKGMLGI